jgi:hypothetical protein
MVCLVCCHYPDPPGFRFILEDHQHEPLIGDETQGYASPSMDWMIEHIRVSKLKQPLDVIGLKVVCGHLGRVDLIPGEPENSHD